MSFLLPVKIAHIECVAIAVAHGILRYVDAISSISFVHPPYTHMSYARAE